MPCRASIALAFHVVKERFGRAETQEHVEPNGDMIVVISHIKVDNTFVFLVFELKISQPKTLVFRAIVGLYGCSSIETDLRRRAVTIGKLTTKPSFQLAGLKERARIKMLIMS